MATAKASIFPRIEFNWILNKKRDLMFYIGSAVFGWLYVAIIALNLPKLVGIENPIQFVLFTIGTLDFTLEWVILLSWGLIFDAPHLFATLARTFFDPEERQMRSKELNRSWLFFLVGPVAILTPYIIGMFVNLSQFILGLGALLFLVFFRLWAYYHVVRQHWGFYQLYRRKSGEKRDNLSNSVDYWFFQLSLYLPLVMFITSDFYLDIPSSAFPDIGLHAAIIGGMSIADLINPVATVLFFVAIIGYVLFQLYLWSSGEVLNGSKLLYMAMIVPLHYVALSHPIIILFLTPIITIGHNLQYHQIVYEYGKKKYVKEADQNTSKLTTQIFSNFLVYAFFGFVFTFLLYRGPLINWIHTTLGMNINGILVNSVGMMAGIRDFETLGLGELIFGSILLGWAMQHYYLDSKIWRVSKDKMVRKNLNVE